MAITAQQQPPVIMVRRWERLFTLPHGNGARSQHLPHHSLPQLLCTCDPASSRQFFRLPEWLSPRTCSACCALRSSSQLALLMHMVSRISMLHSLTKSPLPSTVSRASYDIDWQQDLLMSEPS